MSMRDLFVVVPDLDAENAVKTLLCERQEALGIRLTFSPERHPQGDLLRYAGRDSGCQRDAVELLRAAQRTHSHAVLLFDHHGSGAEQCPRKQVEAMLEQKIRRSGWAAQAASVIVIEPELEAWVWVDSPHVADILGWKCDRQGLRPFLRSKNLWKDSSPKPADPKEAMRTALRQQRKPFGAPLFAQLARHVSVSGCNDKAFVKFRKCLQRWFPL